MNQAGTQKTDDGLLSVDRLSFSFATESGQIDVLADLSITLRHGSVTSIVGPSGCGKSTLLSIIAGVRQALAGSVRIDGQRKESASQDVGLIMQQSALFPWLTCEGHVAFALRWNASNSPRDPIHWLRLVGLDAAASRYPYELSGGMQQRLALARALAANPKVLLLDEPFGALDVVSRSALHDVLLSAWEAEGLTVVFVTHDVDEAVALADRVIVLTARPARVAREFSVELERPRVQAGIRTAGFEDCRNQIAQELMKQVGASEGR